MSKVEKETIVAEIRKVIPIGDFKKGFHQDYDLIVNLFAEDLLKKLPKDHTIEAGDDDLFIVKKEPELEGYDKFVHDAQRIYTGKDDRIPFSGYLEDFINATGRKEFLK